MHIASPSESVNEDLTSSTFHSATLPHQCCSLTLEGHDPKAWTAISQGLFEAKSCYESFSPIDPIILGGAILSAGGRLAILLASDPQKQELAIAAAKTWQERYGVDRVALLPAGGSTFWTHDEVGMFARRQDGTLVQLTSKSHDGWYDDFASRFMLRKAGIESIQLDLTISGGDLVNLGGGSWLVTKELIRKNPERNVDQTLRALGAQKVVAVPAIDGHPSHADVIALCLGNSIIIPALSERQICLAKERFSNPSAAPFLSRFLEGLTRAEKILSKNVTMPIVKIPMLLPVTPFISSAMCSPINMRLVCAEDGIRSALVPLPPEFHDRKKAHHRNTPGLERWPEHDRQGEYQEVVREKLLGAGLDAVHFVTCGTEQSGTMHCLTAELPGEVVDTLRMS